MVNTFAGQIKFSVLLGIALALFLTSATSSLKAETSPSTPVLQKETIKISDKLAPLPAGSIQLTGYLEKEIQNSITHWNKGNLPYSKFVEFFRSGRPQFALGEMWGKAVRSGCMFYRYTKDPELKQILRKTVDDLIHALFENGEADGQRFLFGRLHNAVIDGAAVAVSVLVHYPVSHCGDPGIDTQYNHISSLYAPKRLDNFIET